MNRILFFIIFVYLFTTSSYAQNQRSGQRSKFLISWRPPQLFHSTDGKSSLGLSFENAIYQDNNKLPYYINHENSGGKKAISAEIVNPEFLPVTAEDLKCIAGVEFMIKQDIEIVTKVVYENKMPVNQFQFIPLRKNPETGLFEKLSGFDLKWKYDESGKNSIRNKSLTYASNSVLASGNWFKFNIVNTGVYKITYNDLLGIGLNPDNIDPRNIRIYGNGGAMLPEKNSLLINDDIKENAIFIFGESDGVFNSGDYILFYAKGPAYWIADTATGIYSHKQNKYITSTTYFITADLGVGKRIQNLNTSVLPANYTVTEFDDYAFYELDSVNLIKSGREFYGELFDSKTSYTFDFSFPNIVSGSSVRLKTAVLARSVGYSSNFRIYANSVQVANVSINPSSPVYTSTYANYVANITQINPSSNISIKIEYNKASNPAAQGWLDYVELNAKRNLLFTSKQLSFRNMASIGQGITEFIMGNSGNNLVVWDVTDFSTPRNIIYSMNGSDLKFKINTDSLREFLAFDNNYFYQVSPAGRVNNQNLHGLPQTDMIIISYPEFVPEASRVADYHRNNDNLSVIITTPQEIFNEFSSGNQDITAFKYFIKMFYDRAGGNLSLQPKYVLLFGDASYDCLNRIPENTNLVQIYQTENSLDPTISFATDDYIAFLDDNEEGAYGNMLDVAVGRFSVKTYEEAKAVTDKMLNYKANYDLAANSLICNNTSGVISNFGNWRNVVCLVADDNDDGENFLGESEAIAKLIDTSYSSINVEKIYLDAYPQLSTPGGQRSPQTTDAINNIVSKGALIVNYIGHGGEIGWAHEAILGVSDINNWSNTFNTPLFITATCEFSRCDDPGRTSAGEYVLINPNGGAVALFTTSRLAFSGSNASLNFAFFKNVFEKEGGEYQCLGDIIKKAKNTFGCPSVISNFLLLGNPAMKLAYPEFNILTTHLNNQPLAGISDTIKALTKITIKGYIADFSNVKQTDFNGIITPIVFDKTAIFSTLGSDGPPKQFKSQKNIIYKGKASVINGDFAYTFVVPKDISYNYGKGKLSYYATNGNTDANGFYRDIIIGGTNNSNITDNIGPDLKIYMNDLRFVSGGVTSKNPLLLAVLSDSAGLNTVGNGIGHDIVAIVDGLTEKTYVLNDYYESDLNTYQKGMVRYPFKDIENGSHKLLLKAWDVYNNSSETEIEFVVAESAELALTHVLNYPNPFTTYTEFWFEHNQPCCGLDVQIQIFTITGKIVKTINTKVETSGFRADPIPWDGTDDFGDKIGKGVYLYRLKVKSNTGLYADKIEKLVILK